MIFKFSGGTINDIILCSLPATIKPLKDEPTKVVFRIYCVPDKSVVAETLITNVLAQNSLGPKLYGILGEARMEEYIPVLIFLKRFKHINLGSAHNN